MELENGMVSQKEIVVTESDTALCFKSGDLEVLATPRLISLMEETSVAVIKHNITEDFTTVGTKVNASHTKASLVGTKIKVISTLIKIENRLLTFNIEAFDDDGLIGFAEHERVIVNRERFINKVKK